MTPEQVKAKFYEQGLPIAHWADQHGFRRSDVYRVLNGFTPCRRGNFHNIAVALGLKPAPKEAQST
jgi:gp16 family phage-associated protein